MSTAIARSPATRSAGDVRNPGALALALQEALTVAIRLRSRHPQTGDADALRYHVKALLAEADAVALAAGYAEEYVTLAVYAYVALLDENILNSEQPVSEGWSSQPLQEELFGDQLAGERFFDYLDELLATEDSAAVADVLEVFQLCLLLGFRGRFARDHSGAIEGTLTALDRKILRIRGEPGDLSPLWGLPTVDVVEPLDDPWFRRLRTAAGVGIVLVVVLYALFRILLTADLAALAELTGAMAR